MRDLRQSGEDLSPASQRNAGKMKIRKIKKTVVNTNMDSFGIYCWLRVGKNVLKNEADESAALLRDFMTPV